MSFKLKTKSVRYIKQTDLFRCGPVAVINALKWSGASVTRKDIGEVSEACKCTIHGTYTDDLMLALEELGEEHFKLQYVDSPKIYVLHQHLKHGGAFILRYFHEDGGHYSLCIGTSLSGRIWHFINDGPNIFSNVANTQCIRFRREVRNMLRSRVKQGYYDTPAAILLTKKKSGIPQHVFC